MSAAIEALRKNFLPQHSLGFNLERLFSDSETIGEVTEKIDAIFDALNAVVSDKRTDKIDELVVAVGDIIQQEYRNPGLSLCMIADKIGLTPNYVGRVFKRATGVSVSDRMMSLRLAKAKELLTNTQSSITQISEEIGFSGDGYFYKTFKQTYGCTPADYRKQRRANHSTLLEE